MERSVDEEKDEKGSTSRRSRSPSRKTVDHEIPKSKRLHMDKVVSYVMGEKGSGSEAILLKLLTLTRDKDRWGFLSPEHPHHVYYANRKAAVADHERRRHVIKISLPYK